MTIYTQYGEPATIIEMGEKPNTVIIEVTTGKVKRLRVRSIYNLLADGGMDEIKHTLRRLGYQIK